MSAITEVAGRTYQIVEGPSKDRIIDAFRYTYDDCANIQLEFSIICGHTMPKDHPGCAYVGLPVSDYQIRSISYEDGGGHNFNLRGYCKVGIGSFSPEAKKTECRFNAFYNSHTGTGTFEILD